MTATHEPSERREHGAAVAGECHYQFICLVLGLLKGRITLKERMKLESFMRSKY